MAAKEILNKWNYNNAKNYYMIDSWGNGYFNISEKGEVTVKLPYAEKTKEISILEIVNGVKDRGFSLPIILRFRDILNNSLTKIHQSFNKAIKEYGYKGIYRGVYPIKVNQQEEVIEEITKAGKQFHHGLEAGSKAELIAALAYMHDPNAYIICNGYKDQEFIDLALYALKINIQAILVIERPGELKLILERSKKLNIKPRIGIRVKLTSKAKGLWSDSGGDESVFGLTTSQIVDLIEILKQNKMMDCLELLHYHIGSQIPNISNIRSSITEACRYYVELVKEGAKMGILNIGGGLAVDYDGSKTDFESSKNYSLKEYCSDIVEAISISLDEYKIDHPTIISESGRATVAYYSVLLFNILDVNRLEYKNIPDKLPNDAHEYLINLFEVYKTLSIKNLQEYFHDAIYYLNEIRALFLHGNISLREKALAENIFWQIIRKIETEAKNFKYIPDELQQLDEVLVDIYYGNFSVFQSLPDAWAINQLFPIMPIHRLNEKPKNRAIIADTTCDCDGKIIKFVDLKDIKKYILLHDLKDEEDYIIGTFLVGAYQETLGDLHNLFGDTNVFSICLDDKGKLEYIKELEGDSVLDILTYVEYDPKKLINNFKNIAEQAVKIEKITPRERREIMAAYEEGLRGYTYFEK
jgi:arginine decarboxylase